RSTRNNFLTKHCLLPADDYNLPVRQIVANGTLITRRKRGEAIRPLTLPLPMKFQRPPCATTPEPGAPIPSSPSTTIRFKARHSTHASSSLVPRAGLDRRKSCLCPLSRGSAQAFQ